MNRSTKVARNVTGWVWLALLAQIGVIEWLLVKFKQPTLSQFVGFWSRKKRWILVAVVGALAFLAWHLVTEPCSRCEPPPPPDPPAYVLCEEDC